MAGEKPGGRHGAGSGSTGPVQPWDTVAVMVGDVRQVSIEPPKENLALTGRRIEGEPDGDRPAKKATRKAAAAPNGPAFEGEDAVELYDHQADPQENVHAAGLPANAALVKQLMEQWRKGWKGAMPPGSGANARKEPGI